MLIDSHAHLTSPSVFDHLDEILKRAQLVGINSIINICTDLLTLERGIQLSKDYSWVYQAAATTPHDVEKEGEQNFEIFANDARRGLLKAVGETGLDYFYEHSNREIQKLFLRKYLQLALECQLPVIIHCREAFADFFEILDFEYQINGKHAPGVLHCFTGTMQEAEALLKRNWMISISGIVTFKKSLSLQQIVKEIPLDRLFIETDAPYLAPQKQRGKMNEPSYLVEIAEFVASIKQVSFEELASTTTQNARKFFKI